MHPRTASDFRPWTYAALYVTVDASDSFMALYEGLDRVCAGFALLRQQPVLGSVSGRVSEAGTVRELGTSK